MQSDSPNIIAASGPMADLVRSFPWESTPLGPLATWASAQCVAVNLVLTSSFPACLALGPDLIMIYNDGFVPILGAKPQALGRSFADTWSEAWDSIGPIADKAMNGQSTFIEDYELKIQRYSLEETAYFTFCYSPVFDEYGTVIGILDTVVETTAKVRSERKLQDFASALSLEVRKHTADRDRMWLLSVDCMIVTDARSSILSVNPAFSKLFEWSEAELAGRRLVEFIHPEDQQACATRWAASVKASLPFRVVARVLSKAGRFVSLALTGSHHEGSTLLIGRDITDEKEAEARLKKTELALQQAQKMESLGRLTGGVAHDFNNLLQVISGNLQLLNRVVAGNDKAVRWVDTALASVTKGAKLSNSLLAFGRKQTLEPKVVNVGKAVVAMEDILQRALGDGLTTALYVREGLWNTYVDIAQVENALLNLAINARDAMDGTGTLTVEVDNVVLGPEYAQEHDETCAGDYVMLAVSDTGAGMSAQVLKQAFDPFFTTKPVGKGTGLGLSMVFGFVKQSGGHVKIYSEVGHGTAVKIYLPRCTDTEEKVDQSDLQPVAGGTETILVVEDDLSVQATVIEILGELGYRVLKADDASAALSIIESGIQIDVLFTDVIMPGPLKSPDLARKAKALFPRLAVLYTSGYTENAIVHGGKLDRGVELIGKPYTREALARRIRHVLAKEPKVS